MEVRINNNRGNQDSQSEIEWEYLEGHPGEDKIFEILSTKSFKEACRFDSVMGMIAFVDWWEDYLFVHVLYNATDEPRRTTISLTLQQDWENWNKPWNIEV